MSADDDGDRPTTVAQSRERIISHAQERCHAASVRYIEAANSLDGDNRRELAAAELHNAVIEYYRALQPLSNEDAVSDFWESVVLWTTEGSESDGGGSDDDGSVGDSAAVTGFDRLGKEAVRFRTVTESKMGYCGQRTESRREPVRLPPDLLLRVAQKLDEAAIKLGFSPETDDGKEKTYTIGKNQEDYDDPIDDSIDKPE